MNYSGAAANKESMWQQEVKLIEEKIGQLRLVLAPVICDRPTKVGSDAQETASPVIEALRGCNMRLLDLIHSIEL